MFSRAGTRLLRTQAARRMYAAGSKRDEPPSFKTIALVGLIGTAIFVKAVENLDQNKPRNSFSEYEFDNVMSGLRRRIALFKQDELKVSCIQRGTPLKSVNIPENAKVIKPLEVLQYFRNLPEDKYSALLNENFDIYGDSYIERLPEGLIVALMGKYMKEKCEKGDDVYILDFPNSVSDAIKFENEVSVIDKVVSEKSNSDSAVVKYYETVNKVESV